MKVIVVSAHPDDEALGCGGTLLKHKAAGDELAWLIVTNIFENQGFSSDKIEERQKEIQKASRMMGMSKTYMLDYPTMSLSDETLIEMVPRIGKIFQEFEPEIIYILNRSDAHTDHLITFKSVMSCTKSFRYPFVKRGFDV